MNRRLLGLLFLTLFTVMLGFSILFPIEAFYVESFGASSDAMGVIIMLYSLGQFLFSPLWGRLSDRVGRKPLLLLGLGGYAVTMALFGSATELWQLYVTRALAGILSSATLPTAKAIIADATDAESRTKGMGMLGAAMGLGVVVGPAVGGLLARYGLWVPFYVSAGLALVNLLYVLAVLPESLPPDKRGVKQQASVSPWAAFERQLAANFFISFIVSFSLAGLETTFGFLAANRLALEPHQVGLLFVIMGVTQVVVQGGLIGPLKKRFGEVNLMQVGLVVSALGFAVIAFAQGAVLAAVGLAIFAGGNGLIRPSNISLISQHSKVGQGLAIGLLDSFDSMGRILGPLAGGALYAVRDSLPFFLGALLTLASGVAFALLYGRRQPSAEEVRSQ